MIDAELRGLERRARERPDDRAAGWALAHGLERAGERRRQFLELCRLARLGDGEAHAATIGRTPWPTLRGPGGTKRSHRCGVRRVGRVGDVVLPRRWDITAAASDEVVLISGPEGVVALDVVTLEERWRIDGRRALVKGLSGEEVLTAEDGRVRLRGLRDGAILAESETSAPRSLAIDGDLALGHGALGDDGGPATGSQGIRVVSLREPFGAEVRRFDVGVASATGLVVAGQVYVRDGRSVEAWDPRTGELHWRSALRARSAWTRREAGTLLAADRRGVVVAFDASDGPVEIDSLAPETLRELDAATGETRWSLEGRLRQYESDLALGVDLCVLTLDRRGGPTQIVAIDRSDGTTRWERPLAESDHGASGIARGTLQDLVLADGLAYLAVFWQQVGRVDLHAFDLATGERVLEHGVHLDAEFHLFECRQLRVIPLAGAALVTVSLPGRFFVFRLEDGGATRSG